MTRSFSAMPSAMTISVTHRHGSNPDAQTMLQLHRIQIALKLYTLSANSIVTAAQELLGQFARSNWPQLSDRFERSAVEA